MRKVYVTLTGLAILAIGVFSFNLMSASKKAPEKIKGKIVKSVFVKKAKNKNIPISIFTSGSLLAKDRMAIYAEVQGVFMPSSKAFKTGTAYNRGEVLVRINNEEFNASVVAQRSSFKNMVTGILPDIQFDYPNALQVWKSYLGSIDIHKPLPKLPILTSEQEKNYVASKGINTTYYNIKNLETRLRKYSVSAPYKGVLVDALITPGTLVSPGQKLGEFIKAGTYELELNINSTLQDFLKVGKKVSLTNLNKTENYMGKVTRINPQIDRSTQTIKVFVEVVSNELKEGEYLEANIDANKVANAIEIPRTLLNQGNTIYVVKDSVLAIQPVNVVFKGLNTVVVEGVTDGADYLSKPMPGAFEGMSVKIIR